MAIEFHCPYCTAVIRVPDALEGRTGRCPKCETRLIVPVIERPGQRPEQPKGRLREGETEAPASSESHTQPADAQPSPAQPGPVPPVSGPGAPEAHSPVDAAPTLPSVSPTLMTASPDLIRPAAPASATDRLLRRRKKRIPSWAAVGLPLLFLAVIMGVIGFALRNQDPVLEGTLPGAFVTESPPGGTFDPDQTDLNENEKQRLQEWLRTGPQTLTSRVLRVVIGADDSGLLTIRLLPTDESEIVSVNPRSDPILSVWTADNEDSLEQARRAIVASAATTFCREVLRQESGDPAPIDAQRARDEFALNHLCGGLGFACDLVADKTLVRCSWQDPSGSLYFVVPTGCTDFELRGRQPVSGPPLFPGRYTINVGKRPEVSAESADSPEPDSDSSAPDSDSEPDSAEPDVSPESDPGKMA